MHIHHLWAVVAVRFLMTSFCIATAEQFLHLDNPVGFCKKPVWWYCWYISTVTERATVIVGVNMSRFLANTLLVCSGNWDACKTILRIEVLTRMNEQIRLKNLLKFWLILWQKQSYYQLLPYLQRGTTAGRSAWVMWHIFTPCTTPKGYVCPLGKYVNHYLLLCVYYTY